MSEGVREGRKGKEGRKEGEGSGPLVTRAGGTARAGGSGGA